MANTVSLISYANTFGDWVVTTNALAKENNDFAANNYIKPTGTLYLNDSTLGLQVANNAIVAGRLSVAGIGSSAYVQNNLQIDGQISVGGSGTSLSVSNNATINGSLTVGGGLSFNGALSVGG